MYKYTTLQAVCAKTIGALSVIMFRRTLSTWLETFTFGNPGPHKCIAMEEVPFTCAMDVLPLKLKTKQGYDVYKHGVI